MKTKSVETVGRPAWNVPEWCAQLGIGHSTYYTLAVRPRYIKLGRRHLVVEPPADYAARIAQLQERKAA